MHYEYTQELRRIWEHAVHLYERGKRGAEGFLEAGEQRFLAGIGVTVQEIYDFAEDFSSRGEPDFVTVALIQDVRRAYFFEVQQTQPSAARLDPASLPARDAALNGIVWLPRIIVKAKAKLRGELHPDVMYCCGGDRRFFRENDIHPAEFLRLVWQHESHDQSIVNWVVARRGIKKRAASATGL